MPGMKAAFRLAVTTLDSYQRACRVSMEKRQPLAIGGDLIYHPVLFVSFFSKSGWGGSTMLSKSSLCFGLALAVTVGCNGSSSLPTVPVTGKVLMQDGTPVSGAEVTFLNTVHDGKPASGITDEQGNFKLATYLNPQEKPEGALPGDYNVIIKKIEVPTAPQRGGAGDIMSMQSMEGASKAYTQATKKRQAADASGKSDAEIAATAPELMYGGTAPKNLLPERYSKADTSGFTVTVQKGVEPFIFELAP
jgi:hypothetical protein